MTKQEFNKVLKELEEINPSVDVFDLANQIENLTGEIYYNRALSIGLTEGWIEEA